MSHGDRAYPARAVAEPRDFWAPNEHPIESLEELFEVLQSVTSRRRNQEAGAFAWRGVVNADWGLYGSLYRHLRARDGRWPSEERMVEAERRLLVALQDWSLHHGSRGRLSALEQFALVQHFGGPTRLIDVSLSPYVAVWFAVEDVSASGQEHAAVDGRLFAIDVTRRMISARDDLRAWEDSPDLPWVSGVAGDADAWTRFVYAWRPPRFEGRITAQDGAFILGGVPHPGPPERALHWRRGRRGAAASTYWSIEDVRSCVSLPVRPNVYSKERRSRDAEQPVYVFRIAAAAKRAIRAHVEGVLGFRARRLFPDYSGFGTYGVRDL